MNNKSVDERLAMLEYKAHEPSGCAVVFAAIGTVAFVWMLSDHIRDQDKDIKTLKERVHQLEEPKK